MSIAWLRDLEERVQEASTRLRALKEENAALRKANGELEEQLTAAQAQGEEAAAWGQERDEIRGRVEELANHLEGLLGEDETPA